MFHYRPYLVAEAVHALGIVTTINSYMPWSFKVGLCYGPKAGCYTRLIVAFEQAVCLNPIFAKRTIVHSNTLYPRSGVELLPSPISSRHVCFLKMDICASYPIVAVICRVSKSTHKRIYCGH